MSTLRIVVVDTDVFSNLYLRRKSVDTRVVGWRSKLTGCRVVISFQTRMELLGGALTDSWGAARMRELNAILDRTPTIRADDDVITAHAKLVAACRRDGHGLQHKQHNGDRWVASSAIGKGLELLSGDGIFRNAPGLALIL